MDGRAMVALLTLWGSAPALAGYTMSLSSGGLSERTVQPGDALTLDVFLTSTDQSVHNSSIFRLEFSAPGLWYDAVAWAQPYTNGSPWEDSRPRPPGGGLLLTAEVLTGPAYPADVVDIELSNVVPAGRFGVGRIATLSIAVPSDYAGPEEVLIRTLPDTIADGFSVVQTLASQPFVLRVPGPASAAALLGWAALSSVRRRNPRQSNARRSSRCRAGPA